MATQRHERFRIISAAKTFTSAQDTRNEALRSAYAAGVDVHELVEFLAEGGAPLSRAQVHRIVQGARDGQPPRIDITDAIDRYRDGASLRALGQTYGCAPRVVQKALQAAGVEIRDRETAKRLAAKADA